MAKTTTNQCICSSFDFGTYGPNGDAESYTDYNTGCTQTTSKLFAMGHDAKLVGFMVRAELSGEEISRTEGGMRITFDGAVSAAAKISEALAAKAQAQLDAAKARLAKKAAAAARKAARGSAKKAEAVEEAPEVVELAPIEALIKVGRWTYPAQIDRNTRAATYKKKLGGEVTVADGEYTVL